MCDAVTGTDRNNILRFLCKYVAILLVRYSEIGLKSTPVRAKFEKILKDNMLTMLMQDGVEAFVQKKGARYYVEASDTDKAIASLRKVFGIGSISVAETCSSDMDDICSTAAKYSVGRIADNQSFAVDARREGSQGYTSMDVGREAGSAIFIANEDKHPKVDLNNPDVTFYIEVRDNKAYIFMDYIRCHAGLPVGSQGKIIADITGDRGLVSAWLMMKRGCRALCKGDNDIELLRKYDPYVKMVNEKNAKDALGISMGLDLRDITSFDPSAYELPVFFPTIGMSDDEVAKYREIIEKGL